MIEESDGLPPDVAALVRTERARVAAPASGRARLAERLAASVPAFGALHPPSAPPAAPAVSSAGALKAGIVKGLLVIAAGGAITASIAGRAGHPRPEVMALAPAVTATEVRAAEPFPVLTAEPPRLPAPGVTSPAPARAAPAKAASESAADPREERLLLDAARDAIARGAPEEGLALTTQHATRFPRGPLAVVRDALRVRALARLGRRDEATSLLASLRATYPHSFLIEGAEADVASIP